MQTHFDVIVMGGGPAGSATALLLARAGWSVVLIEKQRFPRRKVCGECVAASNFALLDVLGVGREFAAAAGPELRRLALLQRQHTVLADLPLLGTAAGRRFGRALGRETLDTLLIARASAAGAVVLQPWVVRSVSGRPGQHECRVEAVDSRERAVLHAPVAIDAHGSWETLVTGSRMRRMGPPRGRRGGPPPGALFGFKANFRDARVAAGTLPVLSFAGGYGGMVLAGGGVTTLACCVRADRLAALRRAAPGVAAGEVVGAMLERECRGVAEALRGARRDGPWLASGPLKPGIRLRADDTVFRVGNAAAEAHPIIGEGMSMALQSAFMLCTLLVAARPGGAAAWQRHVAAAYAAGWRAEFAPRLRVAALAAHLAMRPWGSRWLLPIFRRWPRLLERGAVWSGKVRHVPLAAAWVVAAGHSPGETGSTP